MTLPSAVTTMLTGRVPALGPGTPNEPLRATIQAVAGGLSLPLLSAVWLYHDFLDESHEISQELHTPTGSLLHAVMHRREPDAWNSKYWFRRVGSHPVYTEIREAAAELAVTSKTPFGVFLIAKESWDPFWFVDVCEQYRGTGGNEEQLLRHVQAKEIALIAAWCARG